MSGRGPDLEEELHERKKKKRRRVILDGDEDEDEQEDKTSSHSADQTAFCSHELARLEELPSVSQERAVAANDRTQHSPPAVVSRTSPATTFPPQEEEEERHWKLVLLMDSQEWKGSGESQARVLSHLQARNIWVQLQDGMRAATGSLYLFAVVPILNNATTNSASTMLLLDTIITRIRGDDNQWIQDRVSFRKQLTKLKATDLPTRLLIAENVIHHDDSSFQEVCHSHDPHLQVHPTTSAKTSLKIVKKLYKDYLQELPNSFDELQKQLNHLTTTTYPDLVSKVAEALEQTSQGSGEEVSKSATQTTINHHRSCSSSNKEQGSSSLAHRRTSVPAPDAVKSTSAPPTQTAATTFQPVPPSTQNDSQSPGQSASSSSSEAPPRVLVGVSANSHCSSHPQHTTKQAFQPPQPANAPVASAQQQRAHKEQQFMSNTEPKSHQENQHRKRNRKDESAGSSETTALRARLLREEKDTTTSAFSVRKRSTNTSTVPIIPPGAFPRQAQEQAQANLQLLLQQVVRSLDFAKSVPELMRLCALLKKLQDQTTSRLDEINKPVEHAFQECCKVIQKVQERSQTTLQKSVQQLYQSVLCSSSIGDVLKRDSFMQACFPKSQQIFGQVETRATQQLQQALQTWYQRSTQHPRSGVELLPSLQPILQQLVTLERQSWGALLVQLRRTLGWEVVGDIAQDCERAIQEAQTVRVVQLTVACHRLREALVRERELSIRRMIKYH